ncbi:N-acetylneuraminic acid (sialic acid) synthetase [Leptospira biflexa serovar Patoc strain 'Patoc 1 (Ames)']|uniref:Putative N-acetylneuraminic acid (Neu5Ac) synthase, NeuB family n=1 Tax=Leptospira biflexa serovar Patoc (strain Patoc 1 / ATCC 23582 / Paris) TaxID=456481 RepID=B0SSN9_LEPBP|nr:pseudaminic acid synthase [Leptospira biflexa]ABZ94474.1 N-acetylneuraminic acid (sialic acid) synthetase [Leptospira biflexa serovar Patoc strain 'Patoc 1 (Ames)']ABZ98129.1 Putative N-acetylneuraminic acid (Neu5Ac) synthase, NeuB family [Leptospira biflexa serovar Patoc strain 'Patoc 1 (Paris)']
MNTITINQRKIGKEFPPYIIAELSANHNGKIERALETIKFAKESGADAIKIQTYTADTMTIDCDKEDFQIHGGLWDGYKLYDLYKWAETPFEWHKEIFDYAKKIGITIFSTPFDETAVDLLEDLNAPAYKVASFEATDLPLIRYIASTKKPMIMSTGMANYQEILEMVDAARSGGCKDLILLHCISSYPAPIDQSNLLTIPDMREKFGVQIGLSDHTLTNTASITSVALGATVIEKHFIIDRSEKGPDSEFSITPEELYALCRETKDAWLALGVAGYDRKPAEEANLVFRRSLYFIKDLKAGDTVKKGDIRRIRPGYGLAPKYAEELIGKKLKHDVTVGTAVKWELLD